MLSGLAVFLAANALARASAAPEGQWDNLGLEMSQFEGRKLSRLWKLMNPALRRREIRDRELGISNIKRVLEAKI